MLNTWGKLIGKRGKEATYKRQNTLNNWLNRNQARINNIQMNHFYSDLDPYRLQQENACICREKKGKNRRAFQQNCVLDAVNHMDGIFVVKKSYPLVSLYSQWTKRTQTKRTKQMNEMPCICTEFSNTFQFYTWMDPYLFRIALQ